MIKSNKIKISTKNCRKLEYFKSLGYDILSDFIDLNIKDLNVGSRQIVDVICDYCGREVKSTYKEYIRNISKGNKFACSKVCGSIKAKETNLLNIGVLNHMQLPDIQEKAKKTNLRKYGVEFLQQSNEIRKKSKNTLLEKYGVDHISKTDHFKSKYKKTCLENNGVDYPMQSDSIKEKSKNTLLENYGVDNPTKSLYIKELIKNNNLVKYNVEHPMMLDFFKKKLKESLFTKYGVDNITRDDNFRKKFKITNNINYLKYRDNSISIFNCDNGHEFEITSDNYYHRMYANLPICTICYPISDYKSIGEKSLLEYITSIYKGEITSGYRDNLEIDIYLPELNIGFEYNGLYWHSETYKSKSYHIDKLKFFKEKGIRIINIWEDDWIHKSEIIKSQIKNWLFITDNKIYARKCDVKIIDKSDFLDNNHIQGSDNSKVKIGLFYNNEIVSIMTFNKLEGRKKMQVDEWNLSRFCNLLNTNVVGSASKLLSFFIKNYNPKRIISYADLSWSNGNLYKKLGFKTISETNPDYRYIVNNKRVHKQNFKKSKFKIVNQTENEYFRELGYNRIWDCGKIKFEMINQNFSE